MDDETEKMVALKKVYAEIVFNTAKEAAARIMLSERKAHEYRHDLSSTKDEAFRLLLRLKQTMDSQINVMEMRSQDQERKIEELEAQLHEAEDIVSNLREELNKAHMKLDKLAKNQMCVASNVTYKTVDERGNSQSVVREAVLASQVERINNGAHVPSSTNCSLETPSIISRKKQPELYRNGCTQRIRACDGILLKAHFSQAGGLDQLKNVKELSEDKEGERKSVKTPIVAGTMCVDEKKPNGIKEVQGEETVDIMQYLKLMRTRRKKASRYKRNNASSLKRVSRVVKEVCYDIPTSLAVSAASHDMPESEDENTELEGNNSLSSNLDAKLLENCDGKDRILKHIFQRKRKTESVVNDDSNLLIEENPSRNKMAKKQNGNCEPVNSNEVAESSLDGRRMALAAQQVL